MMKKKILSAVLATTLLATFSMPAFATPEQEVIESQQEYERLTKKIDEINSKVYALDRQIEPLIETMENNQNQIDEIEVEVENTKKEIETSKEEINKTEEVLGKRVRELYKSGGQASYLTLLFSADSFNDLLTKIEATSRLVNLDKKVVNELADKQEKLDNKIKSLDEKSDELTKINEENAKTLEEFEVKKAEQEKLFEQAKAEQEVFERDFLAVSERKLIQAQITVIQDSSSSMSDLQSAISQLRSIRDNQIKSSIVEEEINEYIETAKARVAEMEAELEAANKPNRGEVSATGNAIVDFAYGYLGTPYVYGATGPDSFDCSGFTSFVYRNAAGVEITRTTWSQMGVGTSVSYDELQPGDLVFTYGGAHVGIYVGGGSYINAPTEGDVVKVSPVTSFYMARRVL